MANSNVRNSHWESCKKSSGGIFPRLDLRVVANFLIALEEGQF